MNKNKCKFKVGDVIKVKFIDPVPKDWGNNHIKYMGESFIIRVISYNDNDKFEIYCRGVKNFYFLEDEIEDPVLFMKLVDGDFLL